MSGERLAKAPSRPSAVPGNVRVRRLLDDDVRRCFLSVFGDRARELLGCAIAGVLQSVLALPVLLLAKAMFDTAIPAGDVRAMVLIGIGMVVLRLLGSAVELGVRLRIVTVLKGVVMALRERILRRLYRLSSDFHAGAETGVLHARVVQDSQRVGEMADALFGRALPGAIVCVPLLGLMVWLNPTLTLVLALVAPLVYAATTLSSRRIARAVTTFQRAHEGFSRGALFVLDHMELTRRQACEEHEMTRQVGLLATLRDASRTMTMGFALHAQLLTNVVGLSGVLILVVGGVSIAAGAMSIGDFVAFYAAAGLLNAKLGAVLGSVPIVVTGVESLRTLDALLERTELEPYRGELAHDFGGRVALRGVSFGHGDGEDLFAGVDLEIGPGSRVAVVGVNGAGKSTLVDLLLGFRKPRAGALLADGVPYERLRMADLRRRIGVVSQHNRLFGGTILDNIGYGVPDAAREDVRRAAERSLAHEFIARLPGGYDTEVGSDGVKLSGGEIQRICIARAILGAPALLVLDEPTNHLDVESVARLLESLARLPDAPGLLVISHDDAVVGLADEVHRLEAGRLRPIVRRPGTGESPPSDGSGRAPA